MRTDAIKRALQTTDRLINNQPLDPDDWPNVLTDDEFEAGLAAFLRHLNGTSIDDAVKEVTP